MWLLTNYIIARFLKNVLNLNSHIGRAAVKFDSLIEHRYLNILSI